MTTNTIDGITYFDAPETDDYDGCVGCVAINDSRLCTKLQHTNDYINHCLAHKVIWIEPTPFDIKTLQTSQGTAAACPG